MKSLVVVAILALVASACGQATRAFTGKAEKGTTSVLAVDAAGQSFRTVPARDRTFHLDVTSNDPVRIFAVKQTGLVQLLVFAAKPGAPRVTSLIPNKAGSIEFGALSTCDCSGTGVADETTPSDNPLQQCDSNDDGVDDYDQDGDHGEGEGEHHDGDDDGSNTGTMTGGSDDGSASGGDDGGHDGGHDGGDDGSGGDDGGTNCNNGGTGTGTVTAGEGEGEGEGAGEGEGEGEGATGLPPQG